MVFFIAGVTSSLGLVVADFTNILEAVFSSRLFAELTDGFRHLTL